MKKGIWFSALFALMLMCSCEQNYKMEELYGNWECEDLGLVMNRDGTCEVHFPPAAVSKYDTFWATSFGNNKIEFLKDGLILYEFNIKSLEDDVLSIERHSSMKNMSLYDLKRVEQIQPK